MLIHCRRPAMATWFEVWLAGDDAEHLAAVGAAALDEVARVEQLLSRFDRTSEVARVNREAARRAVRVDQELLTVLLSSREHWEQTDGYFDVRAGQSQPGRPFAATVLLDTSARTVQFLDATLSLDFGGYGKGYALDRAALLLAEYGVRSALLHGGTSSVLALGVAEDGAPWQVGVRDPFADAADKQLARLPLTDNGLSSSAVFVPGAAESDLLDPTQGRQLTEAAACVVVAATALDAEVLSTALLAMGAEQARAYVRERPHRANAVGWIDRASGIARLEWWDLGDRWVGVPPSGGPGAPGPPEGGTPT